jgi:hypothetical protein
VAAVRGDSRKQTWATVSSHEIVSKQRHRKEDNVNQRRAHHWPCILLALALIAGAAATASAYTRPTTSPPTDADMVLINGHSWSMGIRILNLTPYEIVEDMSGITAKGSTDISRKTHKSMMFAPVGWPIRLPAVPGLHARHPQRGQPSL